MDEDVNDGADNAMLELEERTQIALEHALLAGLPEEDVRLLCYHCGIKFEDLRYKRLYSHLKPQRKD